MNTISNKYDKKDSRTGQLYRRSFDTSSNVFFFLEHLRPAHHILLSFGLTIWTVGILETCYSGS